MDEYAFGITLGQTTNYGYVGFCGTTSSSDFPCLNALTGYSTLHGIKDMFIAKLKETDGTKIWATYYGGPGYEEKANDLAVDHSQNLYVVGMRESTTPLVTLTNATNDAVGYSIIMKFDPNNALVWASAFGGTNNDYSEIASITIDNNNNVFILGATNASTGYHTMQGSGYLQSTTGGLWDAYIAKFDNNDLLAWSTYWGGSGREHAGGIASDDAGNIYITGSTQSTDFPIYNVSSPYNSNHGNGTSLNYGDVFISKFDNNGNRIKSMYYGGTYGEIGYNIAVDNSQRVYVTGLTQSADFPTPNISTSTLFEQSAFSNTVDAQEDAFLIVLDQTLSPFWATYYGGGRYSDGSDVGFGLATFNSQKLYMVGATNSRKDNSVSPPVLPIPLADMGGSQYYQGVLGGTLSMNDGFFAMFDLTVVPNAINEINFDNGVATIYPNPVIDGQELQIDVDLKDKTDVNLEIVDITGKCILKKTYSNLLGKQILSVNMDNYAKGMYIVKLFDNFNVIAKKIVKQ
jgi:hypothetical protein